MKIVIGTDRFMHVGYILHTQVDVLCVVMPCNIAVE